MADDSRSDLLHAAFVAHARRLRQYVAGRIPDPDAADDIVQDVFLKAQVGRDTLLDGERVAAWLQRIAHHALVDHLRRRRPLEPLPDELVAVSAEPAPAVELVDCLKPFIAALPTTYREALVLSELQGLSQREVAGRLGLSLPGLKSRVQRGRALLRERLLDCCRIERCGDAIVAVEPLRPGCGPACG